MPSPNPTRPVLAVLGLASGALLAIALTGAPARAQAVVAGLVVAVAALLQCQRERAGGPGRRPRRDPRLRGHVRHRLPPTTFLPTTTFPPPTTAFPPPTTVPGLPFDFSSFIAYLLALIGSFGATI